LNTSNTDSSINQSDPSSGAGKVAILASACEKIIQTSSISSIKELFYQHIKQLVSSDILTIGLFNEQTQTIEFDYVVINEQKKEKLSIPLGDKSNPVSWCFSHKKLLIMSDSSKEYNELFGDENVYSAAIQETGKIATSIFWPLIVSDQIIGVVSIQSYQTDAYNNQDQEVIRTLVSITSVALKHAQALQEVETQKSSIILSDENIRTISEIGTEINSTLDLETVLWTVYQHVNKLMDATVFGIGIYDAEKELIRIDLAMEKGQRYKPYTRTMEIKNQFPVWCIENRKAVFINDIRIEGKKYFDVNEYDNWENNRPVLKDDAYSGVPLALIYVPLMLNDMVYGFITVQTFESGSYKDVHVDILRSIAGYTVNAIANANAHQQLEKTKESLRLAKKEAEQIAESKMRFLANMSHEIRTPMNIILGFMNVVLEHEQLSEEDSFHLSTAHTAAKNLLTIIDDILDVTKNESGKLTLESVPFDLFKLLTETGHILSFKAKQKGLDFQLDFAPEFSHYYRGDPVRINQVILNLSGNAIKFTDEGHVKITVCQDEKSEKLLFSVSDTGIGMSEQEAEKIFDSFTQADTSTTRNFGGTGLGTTISRQLVTAMQGEIWVESQQSKGSTFFFTLPLTMVDKSEIPAPTSLEHSQQEPTQCLNILLAEDAAPNALLMSVMMGRKGHQLTIVDNGKKAVDAIKQNDFDIVFMDVQMPVMDGLTATREIRQFDNIKKKNIQIIAMTASALEEDRQACYDAGMNKVQTKPIDFEKLFITLNKFMQSTAKKIE